LIRLDKTEIFKKTGQIGGTANSYVTAMNVWKSIHNPITENMIIGLKQVTNEIVNSDEDKYSLRQAQRNTIQLRPMMDFHNMFVKTKFLIDRFRNKGFSLFDMGCGKGQDINRYTDSNGKSGFNFVVGADQSFDSILGATDSAWARYTQVNDREVGGKTVVDFKKNPMLFVQLDGSKPWTGEYFEKIEDPRLKIITQTLWGTSELAKTQELTKNLFDKYFKRIHKQFDVVNCQFAIHYFFKNEENLNVFCENINSVLKKGGYFIGTCFDGSMVDKLFSKNDTDVKKGIMNKKVLWMVKKKYTDTDSLIGRKIDVYVESINQVVEEYLVYFDILKEKLKKYNIEILNDKDKLNLNISGSFGSFEDIYNENKSNIKMTTLTPVMKEYSFLNMWFVFKKLV
jgi:SAM-dependent methyltransferase